MGEVFLGFVNRAVTAGWLVLAVLVLRLLLRRAPRRVHCLLWGIAALRLILPFSVKSSVSLVPSIQTIVPESIHTVRPVIETGIPAVNTRITGYMQGHYFEGVTVPVGTAERTADILAVIWLIGASVLLLYCAGTWLRLRLRLRTAVCLRGDLWQSEWVTSPFVLGLFRPRIYVPFHLDGDTLAQVEAHERSHIARGDHIWKILAFFLLTAYWFHPLLWAAYCLFCRDLESACDERVIRKLDGEGRKRYSEALLLCASSRRTAAPCPVAFGELDVGNRIRSILNYRKPGLWIILLAVLALIAAAACFLTDPPVKDGRQWLRTRRVYNLTGCEMMVNYGQSGVTSYTAPLSESERKTLASLLRGLSDSQLTSGGAQVGSPNGWSLYFPKGHAALCLPVGVSRSGLILLVYRNEQTYIDSPELFEFLREKLPDTPLVWRCPYADGAPAASLTIRAAFFYDSLDISYCHGTFDSGKFPVLQLQGNGSASLTAGTVTVSPGQSVVWTPAALDGGTPASDSFHLSWHASSLSPSSRGTDINVSALPVYEGGTVTAVDYCFTVLNNSVSLQYTLEGDVLTLETPYPVIDGIHFNDFYDAVRYDIDGDGTEEYCTLGMGPTSGLFTFTFAAQEGDKIKYASIFRSSWYNLSFAYRNGVLVVKGVTQSGGVSYFDISVKDGSVTLSENGEELPLLGSPSPSN